MVFSLRLAIIVWNLFFTFQLGSTQPPPPPPPKLSNSFSAKVAILNSGNEVKSDMFVNYDLKKSLNIFKLGSQGVAEVYQLTIGNKETAYQYIEPFDYCALNPIGGILSPMWDWLANSTYKEGTYEYKGKLLGVWTYENKTTGVTKEAAFLAPDFKIPVYLLSNFEGVMIFEEYDDSTPPPESRFTVPESCKKASLSKTPPKFSNSLDMSELVRDFRMTQSKIIMMSERCSD